MTKSEVVHFMNKIKSYYQNFSTEDYVVDEWYDRLKRYNIDDVYRKFDDHLNGKYRNDIPKLHFITRYLQTPEQKKENKNIQIKCNVCGQVVPLEKHDRHVARHNSIAYIKRNEKKVGQVFDKARMYELTEIEFDRFYNQFLDVLYPKTIGEERERLEKIKFTKA